MLECDMCGKKGGINTIIIEGSKLNVCDSCSKHGRLIEVITPEPAKKVVKNVVNNEMYEYIVPDYYSKVKESREKRKLKQEDLAKLIGEKVSVIHSIESRRLVPSVELAKKLERFLKIKLIEDYDETE